LATGLTLFHSISKLPMKAFDEHAVAPAASGDSLFRMSTKQLTLSWLAELPDEAPAWRELHDDARLLRDIAAAENDVRHGRERPLAEAKQLLEQKWTQRRSKFV
jgi:hypothetical protein